MLVMFRHLNRNRNFTGYGTDRGKLYLRQRNRVAPS